MMYAGLLGGKMHHDEKVLHVDWVTGRDVSPQDLPRLARSLENWSARFLFRSASEDASADIDHRVQTSDTLLQALDEQITYVRQTNHAETVNRLDYNAARDEAYLKASKESKKGGKAKGGNYVPNPPPPQYSGGGRHLGGGLSTDWSSLSEGRL